MSRDIDGFSTDVQYPPNAEHIEEFDRMVALSREGGGNSPFETVVRRARLTIRNYRTNGMRVVPVPYMGKGCDVVINALEYFDYMYFITERDPEEDPGTYFHKDTQCASIFNDVSKFTPGRRRYNKLELFSALVLFFTNMDFSLDIHCTKSKGSLSQMTFGSDNMFHMNIDSIDMDFAYRSSPLRPNYNHQLFSYDDFPATINYKPECFDPEFLKRAFSIDDEEERFRLRMKHPLVGVYDQSLFQFNTGVNPVPENAKPFILRMFHDIEDNKWPGRFFEFILSRMKEVVLQHQQVIDDKVREMIHKHSTYLLIISYYNFNIIITFLDESEIVMPLFP